MPTDQHARQPEWLRKSASGLEGGERFECIYESGNYALVKKPGGSYWSGIGMARKYGPTTWCLVKKGEWCMAAPVLHTGRMNKAKLAECKAAVDKAARSDW